MLQNKESYIAISTFILSINEGIMYLMKNSFTVYFMFWPKKNALKTYFAST